MPELSNVRFGVDMQIPEDYALVSIAPCFAWPERGLVWRVVAALSFDRMRKEGDTPTQAGTVGTGFGPSVEDAFIDACRRCEEALVQRREAMAQLQRATHKAPAKFDNLAIEVDL